MDGELKSDAILLGGLAVIGYLLYRIGLPKLQGLFGNLGAAVKAPFQAVATTVQSGADAAANQARIEDALSRITTFPAWLPIPGGDGLTAGDMYASNYTTEDIKYAIRYYAANYASDATAQNTLLYQLGQAAASQPDYSQVTP